MVCRRYIENRDFSSAPYWKLSAFTEKEGMSLKAIGVIDYESESSAQTALAALRSQSRLTIESVTRKVGHTSPPLLYDLTALQKEANRCHGFSADKTLSIAQSLYEKKITTYPRKRCALFWQRSVPFWKKERIFSYEKENYALHW